MACAKTDTPTAHWLSSLSSPSPCGAINVKGGRDRTNNQEPCCWCGGWRWGERGDHRVGAVFSVERTSLPFIASVSLLAGTGGGDPAFCGAVAWLCILLCHSLAVSCEASVICQLSFSATFFLVASNLMLFFALSATPNFKTTFKTLWTCPKFSAKTGEALLFIERRLTLSRFNDPPALLSRDHLPNPVLYYNNQN